MNYVPYQKLTKPNLHLQSILFRSKHFLQLLFCLFFCKTRFDDCMTIWKKKFKVSVMSKVKGFDGIHWKLMFCPKNLKFICHSTKTRRFNLINIEMVQKCLSTYATLTSLPSRPPPAEDGRSSTRPSSPPRSVAAGRTKLSLKRLLIWHAT